MLLRGAAMAVTATLGAAFAAGAAAGIGAGVLGVAAACAARQAMKRRRDWKEAPTADTVIAEPPPEAEPLPM